MAASDTAGENLRRPQISAEEIPVEGFPVYGESEEVLGRYGLERNLDSARTQLASMDARQNLLQEIRSEHPDIDGNAERAAEELSLNMEELQKKETFLTSAAKFPLRHPWITGIAALYAAYQFGFSLPAAIEKTLSAVPLEKMKDIIQSIGPMGGAVSEGPAGMMPSAPGLGVG